MISSKYCTLNTDHQEQSAHYAYVGENIAYCMLIKKSGILLTAMILWLTYSLVASHALDTIITSLPGAIMTRTLFLRLFYCTFLYSTLHGMERFGVLCEQREQEKARQYLRENPACITKRYKGMLPLHIAAFYGLTDLVRDLLIERNTDHTAAATEGDVKGFNALHIAAGMGHLAVVACLLEQCKAKHDSVVIDNTTHWEGFNALHIAVATDHPAIVDYLLKHSNIKHDSLVASGHHQGQHALHIAAGAGYLTIVKHLIEHSTIQHDSLVDGGPFGGHNALHLAADQGHLAVIKYLLDKSKIKPDSSVIGNEMDWEGFNALHLAAHQGHLAVVEYLLQQNKIRHTGIVENGRYQGHNALHMAAGAGYATVVAHLLEHSTIKHDSVIVDGPFGGHHALHLAADQGHLAVVKCLLEKSTIKPDSPVVGNVMDWEGFNALHLATYQGNLAIVEHLLKQNPIKHNSVVEHGLWQGFNALHIAADQGHSAIIEHLLGHSTIQHDSVVDGNRLRGFNVFHIAAYTGKLAVVEYLLRQKTIQHNSTVQASNMDGFGGFHTLHLAAHQNYSCILDALISSGKTDYTTPVGENSHGLTGYTPLRIAMIRNALASAKLLVYAGAPLDYLMQPTNETERYCLHVCPQTQSLIAPIKSLVDSLEERKKLLIRESITGTSALLPLSPFEEETTQNIQWLVTAGADIDYYDTTGRTILHAAMGPGNPDQAMPWDELARWLIMHKRNLLIKSVGQQSENPEEELPRWIDRVAHNGSTPLSLAARNNNRRMVLLLLGKRPGLYSLYSAIQECVACNHDMLRKIFLRAAYGPDITPGAQAYKRAVPDDTTPTGEEDSQQLTAKKQRL